MALFRKRSRWERMAKPSRMPKSVKSAMPEVPKLVRAGVADLSKPIKTGLADLPAAIKPGLAAAGGFVGLTAVSAGVSSLRRQSERTHPRP